MKRNESYLVWYELEKVKELEILKRLGDKLSIGQREHWVCDKLHFCHNASPETK